MPEIRAGEKVGLIVGPRPRLEVFVLQHLAQAGLDRRDLVTVGETVALKESIDLRQHRIPRHKIGLLSPPRPGSQGGLEPLGGRATEGEVSSSLPVQCMVSQAHVLEVNAVFVSLRILSTSASIRTNTARFTISRSSASSP